MSERGWRTRGGELASYDDISVFVIPLIKYTDLQKIVTDKKTERTRAVSPSSKENGPSEDTAGPVTIITGNKPSDVENQNKIENQNKMDTQETVNGAGKVDSGNDVDMAEER